MDVWAYQETWSACIPSFFILTILMKSEHVYSKHLLFLFAWVSLMYDNKVDSTSHASVFATTTKKKYNKTFIIITCLYVLCYPYFHFCRLFLTDGGWKVFQLCFLLGRHYFSFSVCQFSFIALVLILSHKSVEKALEIHLYLWVESQGNEEIIK